MEQVEEMSPSEFDDEPGQILSEKPKEEPKEEGLTFDLENQEPKVSDPEVAEEPALDTTAELQAKFDALEAENENLRSSTGRLGTQLQDQSAQLRMFQQQPAPGIAASPEYDSVEPDVKAYIDGQLQQQQQQQFFLETAKSDMAFKSSQSVTPEQEHAVQQYQMLSGIASFKDAYHSCLSQGIVRKPTAEAPKKPQQRIAVVPKNMPQQTAGGTKSQESSESGTVNWEKFGEASGEAQAEYIKKKFYSE